MSMANFQRDSLLFLYQTSLRQKSFLSPDESRDLSEINKALKSEETDLFKKYLIENGFLEPMRHNNLTNDGIEKIKTIREDAKQENRNGISYASYSTVYVILLFLSAVSSGIITINSVVFSLLYVSHLLEYFHRF